MPASPAPLAQRPQDDEVVVLVDQGGDGGAAELVVRLVDDDHDAQIEELPDAVVGREVARGVVGVRQEEQLGPGPHGAPHGLDVHVERLAAGHGDEPAVLYLHDDRVHAEGRREVDGLVAGAEEEAREQVDELVGAGARHEVVDGRAGVLGEGLAHLALGRVRVDVVGVLGKGLRHLGRRAVGVLVAVDLDDLVRRDAQPLSRDVRRVHGRVGRHLPQVGLEETGGVASLRHRLSSSCAALPRPAEPDVRGRERRILRPGRPGRPWAPGRRQCRDPCPQGT